MQMMQVCRYVHRFNRVKGIVTRKDLLGYKLDEAVQVLLTHASEACAVASSCGAVHVSITHLTSADVHRIEPLTCLRARRALVLTSRGLSDCAAL